MITCQCAEAMPTYAPQSSYLTPIPSANIERGVAPLDSLPADWWNWLWNNITLNEARIVQFINSVFSEINSVLSAAGVTPSTASTTDLKTAIQKLATTVATSAVPGSVLSSTLSGKLRVIADGTASINGLGTPDQLETTSKEVVSAINEVLALAQGKAPTSHASSATTYGVGTTQQYGHVKLCDSAADVTAASGVAATPAAVKSVADSLASYQSSNNSAVAGKAPTSHASSDTTYGVGTTQQYGHVKVTEGCGLAISCGTISLNAPGYNCVGTVTQICYNGAAYSPSDGVVNLGNAPTGFPGYGTAICPLNGCTNCASSAGTSNLVARADHVHQMPDALYIGGSFMCLHGISSALGARRTCALIQGSGNVSLYMRGCCVPADRDSSLLSIGGDPYGERIVVTAHNSRGCQVSQAYLPRVPVYTWDQVRSCLGIGTGYIFSGGYICSCTLLGGYFDVHCCVHYRVFSPVNGCIYSCTKGGSDTACIQGVITWQS